MDKPAKLGQLQIRISAQAKATIQAAARRAGLDMSAYVLARVLPDSHLRTRVLFDRMISKATRKLALAEFSSWLNELSNAELAQVMQVSPAASLPAEVRNYLAAMIELVCGRQRIAPPPWTRDVAPLRHPYFASALVGLRLHLLTHSPPPFRRRNLFVDTSVGGQV